MFPLSNIDTNDNDSGAVLNSSRLTAGTFPLDSRHTLPTPDPVDYSRHGLLPSSRPSSRATGSTWTAPDFALDALAFMAPSGPSSSPLETEQRPTRKSRRQRPHIELAPDQPPTTEGKPRARVFVACLQCRNRKIRCDGAKPACHNCSHRASGSVECSYDSAPKRRGPDRLPGARRIAREESVEDGAGPSRRRRRTHRNVTSGRPVPVPPLDAPTESSPTPSSHDRGRSSTDAGLNSDHEFSGFHFPVEEYMSQAHPVEASQSNNSFPLDFTQVPDVFTLGDLAQMADVASAQSSLFIEYDEDGNEVPTVDIPAVPSLEFTRKTWWDSVLSLYTSPFSPHRVFLSASQRHFAMRGIANELRYVFQTSNYWFSFFHVPSFFNTFFEPQKRQRMQPSLVLSLLAIATFTQSSELGRGQDGRSQAAKFRDEAQSSLEASFNAGWIDDTLAQAAWLLAFFEICAHPDHNTTRTVSAMTMLDSIVRSLSLTMIDADNPHVSTFASSAVPAIPCDMPALSRDLVDAPLTASSPLHHHNAPPDNLPQSGCSCNAYSLGATWSGAQEHTPLWTSAAAWDSEWCEAEIRKESCRRLSWSAMMIAAGHTSYTSTCKNTGITMFITDPANYALLFPGEVLLPTPSFSSSKETIWALHYRVMLLWHSCLRMRRNPSASPAEKSHFGITAWLEADALEAAFKRHTCDLERTFLFQGRQYLFNIQMCISNDFQRFIPLATANVNGLFHRTKAEEWLAHQAIVGKHIMHSISTLTHLKSSLLAQRPFLVFWFMGQLSRALTLWSCDRSLTSALDVAKILMGPINYLTTLWPSPEQRVRYEVLRERLTEACYESSIPPPTPFEPEVAHPHALL